jgi:hypothetical protein
MGTFFPPDPTGGMALAKGFREPRRSPRAPPETLKWLILLGLHKKVQGAGHFIPLTGIGICIIKSMDVSMP